MNWTPGEGIILIFLLNVATYSNTESSKLNLKSTWNIVEHATKMRDHFTTHQFTLIKINTLGYRWGNMSFFVAEKKL